LRIGSSQPIGANQWSRSAKIVDRFAKFWAAHPETIPPGPLLLPIRPEATQFTDDAEPTHTNRRAA
jgi:hypothetical protein